MDLLLIPRYGIHGAAWANLIGQVFGGIAIFIFIIVTVKPKIPWGDLLRIGVASVICGLVAKAVIMIDGGLAFMVLAIAAAAVVYPVALALSGALGAGDLEILAAAEKLLPARLRSPYRFCTLMLTRLIRRRV
jgi:O-antigen/teichoic acid export membrane protein